MNNPEVIIDVKNLVKRFGNFVANDHLNFQVYKSEIFGFLGANGAGKTTAIKILCGLLKPSSGNISLAGFDVRHQTEMVKKNIGYMSQKYSLYDDLSTMENLKFFAGIYGLSAIEIKNKAAELIDRLQLQEFAHLPLHSLPPGWKQKIAFSIAIFHKPAVVFLDEPTSGVDPIVRREFWKMIYEAAANGITIFITTHYMDEAEYCDRVCILVDGKIKALDTPHNLKSQYNASSMNQVFLSLARTSIREETK